MKKLNRRHFLAATPGFLALPALLWQKPETILYNGNFITVDPMKPRAEAIAIGHQHILAVGSNSEIKALGGRNTLMIDLAGSTVTPGFIDAHSHPGSAGRSHLFNVDCDLRSIKEIQDAIRERAVTTPKGEVIQGFKYDDTKTKEGRFLHRKDLDLAAPDHVVIITHRGGHSMYVNSLAFKKAGITATSKSLAGGEYVVENGELTGQILENAAAPFRRMLQRPERKDYVAGVEAISNMLAKAGITSVTDAGGSPDDLEAYHSAYAQGLLKTRVYCHIRYPHLDKMISAGVKSGFGNEWVRVGAMKTGIDGSISERTARLSQSYIGRPDDFGILTSTPEQLYEQCKKAHDAGWQIGVHSNGDVGIDITLGVYEKLMEESPRKDPRFRLEHCTVINPELIQRIKALNAIPCPFSTYVYFHGEKMKEYGAERLNSMFAVRSFLDAGIMVNQTSDYPPGPFEPLMAIQSSVTRTDYKGTLWGPKQKVSVEEAIKVGTLHGAYASFEENIKGSITPGKLADLTVLDKDLTKIDPFAIMNCKIERTMVGGRWVYES